MSEAELVVECPCGVEIRSTDRQQLITLVQDHATSVHDMQLDGDQVMDMAHPA